MPVSMLPDVVEADEELTGRRREGILTPVSGGELGWGLLGRGV